MENVDGDAMNDPLLGLYENLFIKTQLLNLALALQPHFMEWCLMHFGKELFRYIYTHIYVYIYIHKNRQL